MGGTDSDEGNAVAVDNDGNIIISGMIIGDVDFNHDGDYNDDAESSTNYGYSDVFVSVYNSSGVLQWAKRMGGTAESGGVTDCGLSLAVDTQNNIILTGQVYLNADLNGDGDMLDDYESSLEYVDWDMFISKFNSSGSYQWTKRISNGNNYDIAYGIASDSINNIIITGFVGGDIDFNEDGDFLDEFESGSTGLCFTAMYNSSGTFQWVRKINGTALENEGRYVQVKSNNNIVIIGNVKDNADINCDGDYLDNAESSTGYGSVDVLMAEYNSSGALQTAKRLGGADYDIGRSIAIDSNNSIYATGRIIGTADYNGDGDKSDNNIEKTAGYGLSDIFISKFNNGL